MVIYFKKTYWTIIPQKGNMEYEFFILPEHFFNTKKEAEEYRKKTYSHAWMWKARRLSIKLSN